MCGGGFIIQRMAFQVINVKIDLFFHQFVNVLLYITSHFEISIDVKTFIIGQVLIQTKFCVLVGREQNFE